MDGIITDKRRFEIKTDAITAIEERFGFERKIIGEMEKTKMLIAHPGWVEFSAGIPKPEVLKLDGIMPMANHGSNSSVRYISSEIRKPETNVKRMELDLAMPEIGENAKKRGQHKLF